MPYNEIQCPPTDKSGLICFIFFQGEVKPTSHPGSLNASSEDLTSTHTDGGNRIVRKTSTNNGNIRSTNAEGSHVRTRSVGKVEYVAGKYEIQKLPLR